MARFYFDLRDGEFYPDHEGVELEDVDTAVAQAELALTDMMRERVDPRRDSSFAMIEIRSDESAETIRVVSTTVIDRAK
jgi:hypothetical protein